MDTQHRLYSSGWNDHGNLGIGSSHTEHEYEHEQDWSAVLDEDNQQLILINPWTESVSCGGAHVICTV
jgi:alpha-tubulin suppressor-like RCC1 family protein